MLALDVIGGKWKSLILYYLKDGTLRSGYLQRRIGKPSNKVYAQALHELEKDGLIHKKAYPVSPPYVEYSLTDEGMHILPVIKDVAEWGKSIAENIEQIYES